MKVNKIFMFPKLEFFFKSTLIMFYFSFQRRTSKLLSFQIKITKSSSPTSNSVQVANSVAIATSPRTRTQSFTIATASVTQSFSEPRPTTKPFQIPITVATSSLRAPQLKKNTINTKFPDGWLILC